MSLNAQHKGPTTCIWLCKPGVKERQRNVKNWPFLHYLENSTHTVIITNLQVNVQEWTNQMFKG